LILKINNQKEGINKYKSTNLYHCEYIYKIIDYQTITINPILLIVHKRTNMSTFERNSYSENLV